MSHTQTKKALTRTFVYAFVFVLGLKCIAQTVDVPIHYGIRPMHRAAAAPRAESLAAELTKRETLLQKTVTVRFTVLDEGDAPVPTPVTFTLSEHPEWIEWNPNNVSFYVSEDLIARTLRAKMVTQPVSDIEATDLVSNDDYTRASIHGIPSEGFSIDVVKSASLVADALYVGKTELNIPASYHSSKVIIKTEHGDMVLERLSRGRSNFSNSPTGRSKNVDKVIEERINGVVLQPDETFSFNEIIKKSGYWADALVIVDGYKLVAEPGGGICQGVTTLFRAALLAGLPIDKRKSHSLYVTYYKDYGVGLDATFYPGKQDFQFTNNTGNPIVFVGWTQGNEAFVDMYGIPDGRSVDLFGPFFAVDNETAPLQLKKSQIGWIYNVTTPTGELLSNTLISSYNGIPKKLHEEFVDKPGITLLTAK